MGFGKVALQMDQRPLLLGEVALGAGVSRNQGCVLGLMLWQSAGRHVPSEVAVAGHAAS